MAKTVIGKETEELDPINSLLHSQENGILTNKMHNNGITSPALTTDNKLPIPKLVGFITKGENMEQYKTGLTIVPKLVGLPIKGDQEKISELPQNNEFKVVDRFSDVNGIKPSISLPNKLKIPSLVLPSTKGEAFEQTKGI